MAFPWWPDDSALVVISTALLERGPCEQMVTAPRSRALGSPRLLAVTVFPRLPQPVALLSQGLQRSPGELLPFRYRRRCASRPPSVSLRGCFRHRAAWAGCGRRQHPALCSRAPSWAPGKPLLAASPSRPLSRVLGLNLVTGLRHRARGQRLLPRIHRPRPARRRACPPWVLAFSGCRMHPQLRARSCPRLPAWGSFGG